MMREPTGEKDYKYSLDLLQRINDGVFKDGGDLGKFYFEGYNIWYFIQSSLFSEIKAYSAKREVSKDRRLSFKGFFVSLILLFLSSLSFLYLILVRKKALVFSIDSLTSKYKSDYRLESLYDVISENGVSYFELFHTIPDKNSISRFFKRMRPALYLESVDFIFFLKTKLFAAPDKIEGLPSSSLLNFSDGEKEAANFFINKYLQLLPLIRFRIKFLNKILRILDPKIVLSIDDTRYYNELFMAAKTKGIPSIAFQHGHFTRYHVGWMKQDIPGSTITPDALCVWSSFWKEELGKLNSVFPPESVVVSGFTLNAVQVSGSPLNLRERPGDKIIKLLIPYETDAPKAEVRKYLEKISRYPNIKIIFKIRPNRDKLAQLREYHLESKDVTIARDLSEIINSVDVVGGVYSTILYDMVFLLKPVFIMDTSMDYGEGMIKNGLAQLVTLDDVPNKIIDMARTPTVVLEERKEKISDDNPKQFNAVVKSLLQSYNII